MQLSWLTPARRAGDEARLADDAAQGVWWAEIGVSLKPAMALRLVRGEAHELAGAPHGVSATITRCGLTRATVRFEAGEADAVIDALAWIDVEATYRLHQLARGAGLD